MREFREANRVFAAEKPELARRLDSFFTLQKNAFDRRFGRLAGASGRGRGSRNAHRQPIRTLPLSPGRRKTGAGGLSGGRRSLEPEVFRC
jgi:hypothetical protein